MNRTSLRRIAAPGIAALALSFTVSACGAATRRVHATPLRQRGHDLSGQLAGAGASSQEKAQEAWSTGFQGANADVTVNYDPVGSGDGRKQFIAKGVASPAATRLPQRRRGRAHRGQGALRRHGPDRGPGVRLPDRRRLQPRGRRLPPALGEDHRLDLRQQDHRVERPGDRRGEPRRRPAGRARSRRCTAPTTRAPRRTSPTT